MSKVQGIVLPATFQMRSPDREFECRNDGGESARSGGDDAKRKVGDIVCTRNGRATEPDKWPEDTR